MAEFDLSKYKKIGKIGEGEFAFDKSKYKIISPIETDEAFQKVLDSGSPFDPSKVNPDVLARAQSKADAELGRARKAADTARDTETNLGRQLAFAKGTDFLGLSDEIAAGGAALGGGDYQSALADIRKSQNQSSDNHPLARFLGAVTTPMPGAGLFKSVSGLGGSALRGATTGGISGAAQGFGDAEGDDIGSRFLGALKGGAKGAGAGAVLNTAGAAAMNTLKSAGQKLQDFGSDFAMKAVGRPTPTMQKELGGIAGQRALGTRLVDEGIVKPIDTPARVRQRLADEIQKRGEAVGQVSEKIDTAEPARAFMRQLSGEVDAFPTQTTRDAAIKAAMTKEVENLNELYRGQSTIPFSQLQKQRRAYDASYKDMMKAELGDKEAAISKEAQDNMRKIFKQRLEELASMTSQGKGFQEANKAYSELAGLRPLIEKAEEDAARLNFLGLTDSIAGIGAGAANFGATGDILGATKNGLLTSMVSKIGRTFGPPAAANVGVKGGRALESLGSKELPEPIRRKIFQGLMDYFEKKRGQ